MTLETYTPNPEEEKMLPKFTDEEIESIKSVIDNKELISDEDKEKIKKLRSLAIEQDLHLSRLFVRCYDYLMMIHQSILDDDEDFSVRIKDYLDEIGRKTHADSVRDGVQQLEEINQGIGTFFYNGLLKSRAIMHRQDYLDMINFFIKIGGVED